MPFAGMASGGVTARKFAARSLRTWRDRGRDAVLLSTLLAACSHHPSLPPAPPSPSIQSGRLEAPPPYKIQVGDILAVRLITNPELDEEVTVRPDGRISTTIAHDAVAYGRTVPDLDRELDRAYQKQLKDPHVSVVVKSFAPTRIYVGGEVANPGEFVNVGPSLTLSQALTRAGGAKISGDEAAVFIVRRGPNDVPEFFSARYSDVIGGKDPIADVRLAPYDLVFVPRTGIAEVYKFFNQYFQQFVPLNWGFSYVVNPGSTGVVPIR
jgi:polysaccharide export outer membrane protein